nr:potassium transporter 7-like [Tanacetum cinerariifolium]
MAEEDGSVSERYSSMESSESSRWVLPDNDSEIDHDHYYHDHDDDDDDDLPLRNGMDSEDEDNAADHRLIRTGPLIDSLDVETLEVSGAQRNDFEVLFELSNSSGFLLET